MDPDWKTWCVLAVAAVALLFDLSVLFGRAPAAAPNKPSTD